VHPAQQRALLLHHILPGLSLRQTAQKSIDLRIKLKTRRDVWKRQTSPQADHFRGKSEKHARTASSKLQRRIAQCQQKIVTNTGGALHGTTHAHTYTSNTYYNTQ
jgi:hypothetical protein